MSPQDDDEGTVIRPVTAAPNTAPGVTLPSHQFGAAAHSGGAEDGLSLRIGTRLGEFEITGRVGEGGFSIVYLALDHSLERTVALKEYMPSSLAARVGTTQVQPRSERYRDTFETGLRSFVNEAKLLAQFDHPSLVKVYRFWEANGTAYMVMPFYQGVTVKDAVRAMPDRPDEAWLLTLLAPLTQALLVIHAERCYHRDIAPDNVILLAGSDKPLLLDFGAARRVIGDMTQGLTVILKSGYAPVEQYAEVPGMKQGPWTDVYALAAVVYWTITGSTPPPSVGRMLSDSFVPLATCAAGRYSDRFLQAIDRALVVRPEQRTQSIGQLRQELGLDGSGMAIAPPPAWSDGDATIIRPGGGRTLPAAVAPRESNDLPRTTARTTGVGHTPAEVTEHAEVRPQRKMLAFAGVGVAIAIAGAWWVLREPSMNVPHGESAGGVTSAAPERATPSAAAAIEPTASMAPPAMATGVTAAAETAATPAAAREAAPEPAADTSKSIPTAPTLPPDHVAETPPPRAATRKAPAADDDATRRPPVAERTPARPDAERRERTQADSGNRAECARVFQRLSLGESSAELLDRLKTLKCR